MKNQNVKNLLGKMHANNQTPAMTSEIVSLSNESLANVKGGLKGDPACNITVNFGCGKAN